MVDYRDNFDTRSGMYSYQDTGKTSSTGPIIALGVIALLIVGIFFMSGGTGNIDTEATAPAVTAPSVTDTVPAAQ